MLTFIKHGMPNKSSIKIPLFKAFSKTLISFDSLVIFRPTVLSRFEACYPSIKSILRSNYGSVKLSFGHYYYLSAYTLSFDNNYVSSRQVSFDTISYVNNSYNFRNPKHANSRQSTLSIKQQSCSNHRIII